MQSTEEWFVFINARTETVLFSSWNWILYAFIGFMWSLMPSSTLKILILLSWLNIVWACKCRSGFKYAANWAVLILSTLPPCSVVTAHLEATGHENKYFFINILLTAPLLVFFFCKLFLCPVVCGRWMVLYITFFGVQLHVFLSDCFRLPAYHLGAPDCQPSCGLLCQECAAYMQLIGQRVNHIPSNTQNIVQGSTGLASLPGT